MSEFAATAIGIVLGCATIVAAHVARYQIWKFRFRRENRRRRDEWHAKMEALYPWLMKG